MCEVINMKKLVILIALALAGQAFQANAQEESSERKVRFGIKRGLNLSTIYSQGNGDFHPTVKVGLVMGAFLTIPISPSLGLQPELLYSSKGFRGEWPWLGTTYAFTRTTGYIDMPLLLAFKAGPHVSFLAGPHVSYLLFQKDEVKNADFSVAHHQTFSSANPRRNAMGLTAGTDFYIRAIVIGGRAGFDLTRNTGDGTSSMPTYKNIWLQASIGFAL
jgi:hypothetical protein